MDELDRNLLSLLRVNARLPLVRLAKALGIARSTAQLRLKALEDSGAITGYTVSLAEPLGGGGIRAIVMIAVVSAQEGSVVAQLRKRHEVSKIYSISGRYDLCAMLDTVNTADLDATIDRIRGMAGVNDTFSTILLATRLSRPDAEF